MSGIVKQEPFGAEETMQEIVLPRIKVSFRQAMTILLPYLWHLLKEQIIVVVPVCLYMVLVQVVVLKTGFAQSILIAGGIGTVIIGLMFFLEGLKIGLVPMGEAIGDKMPQRCSVPVILVFAFLLGCLAAFAEPVLGSLQLAGAGVDPQKAPLLYKLLMQDPWILSLTICFAVGTAVLLGTLRFLYGWSLKPLILPLVGICIVVTIWASRDHNMKTAIGLAWDTGAVIVGPVLCPLVLSLGLGVCRATGRSDSGMAGFGMVGLISVMPIFMVTVLTFFLSPEGVTAKATVHSVGGGVDWAGVAGANLLMGLQAVAPTFLFLFLFMRFWLREKGPPTNQIILGAVFAVSGLLLFFSGLTSPLGLAGIGDQVGARIPLTFTPPGASLYSENLGKIIVVAFGAILGYGATLAEPAFNVLGQQVEEVTQGAFKKWLFGQAVALGVGIGAGMGMFSLVYGVELLWLLLPPYILLFILTLVNEEKYVNIAWDGGAVTTGPVTVPLKIAVGLALAHATGFAEGFGVLALASAYPVLNILLLGLYVKYQQNQLQITQNSNSGA
jgi:hypothetical protein